MHLQSNTHQPRNQDGDLRALQAKLTAEVEEMLQKGHVSDCAAVVTQVTHWDSSWRAHSSILSHGANIKGKNSIHLMQVLNRVIGFVKLRQRTRRWCIPSPAHTCLSHCHEPGLVPSLGCHSKEIGEGVQ